VPRDPRHCLDDQERQLVRPAPHPHRLEPQLAQAAERPPSGPGWITERKLDGVRLAVHVRGERVRLLTRLGSDRCGSFPELSPPLRRLGSDDLVADAEVVAFDGEHDSFSRLQRRLGGPGRPTASVQEIPLHLYLFDLLHLDGVDLRRLPLLARKRLLATLTFVEPVRMLDHAQGEVAPHLADACARGWEGVIVKRADAVARAGRSASWRKLRCRRQGLFVVGGWTPPQGGRVGIGALLVGSLAGSLPGQGLRYAGRVGTGMDDATLAALAVHLERAETSTSPFLDAPREPGVRFVVPHLVVEVRFGAWTPAGRLRHPSLVAVRPDLDVTAATGEQ
jgi:bifunctional non-homologous end joining protein LigD